MSGREADVFDRAGVAPDLGEVVGIASALESEYTTARMSWHAGQVRQLRAAAIVAAGARSMGAVIDATKETFADLVESGLVLVDVWAQSCRPCVALGPHMTTVASANPELTVVKLDASKARRQCMTLQVRGLPTLLLYQHGQEVARITDTNLVPAQLDQWLAAELARLTQKEES